MASFRHHINSFRHHLISVRHHLISVRHHAISFQGRLTSLMNLNSKWLQIHRAIAGHTAVHPLIDILGGLLIFIGLHWITHLVLLDELA